MLGLRVCKSIANPVTNSNFATICTDLHACKLLVCTHGKLRGKCSNGREAVRRKSVANPLQANFFATNLHACKLNANIKFASAYTMYINSQYARLLMNLCNVEIKFLFLWVSTNYFAIYIPLTRTRLGGK